MTGDQSYKDYAKDKTYIKTMKPLLDEYIKAIPSDMSCDMQTLSSLIIMSKPQDIANMLARQKRKQKILQNGIMCVSWHKSAPYGFAMIVTDRHNETKYIIHFVSTQSRAVFWKGHIKILFFDMKNGKQDTTKRIEDMIESGFIKDLLAI